MFDYNFMTIYCILVPLCGKKDFFADIDKEETLRLPPYSGDYSGRLNCWYSIVTTIGKRIRFWVESFGITKPNSGRLSLLVDFFFFSL